MKLYWLLKTEPTAYSIEDLKRDKKTEWTGVRNYQARNFIRDGMQVGDMVLIYHSGDAAGVYGVAKITKEAFGDPTALDSGDSHYDSKSTRDKPIWYAVEVAFVEKFKEAVSLGRIKIHPKLEGILVAQKGSRLSVQPVSEQHFKVIVEMTKP